MSETFYIMEVAAGKSRYRPHKNGFQVVQKRSVQYSSPVIIDSPPGAGNCNNGSVNPADRHAEGLQPLSNSRRS